MQRAGDLMKSFEFAMSPRILFKSGAVADLPAVVASLRASRVLLVTDAGLVQSGHVANALDALNASPGMQVFVFSEVEADPPERVIYAAAEFGRNHEVDAVVGFGGGSAMDAAKLVAYLLATDCKLEAIYGVDVANGLRLPLVLVPTTAGTGSEVTPISIVTTESQEKRGVVSRLLLPDVALLDPALTVGLPWHVTAATGIDAMVHAIEAYTSRHRKNPLSDILARRALELLTTNLSIVTDNPGDLDARASMLLGSTLAGMAFANAPVAAVHALAYPLGGRYHVAHGLSNALMLMPVLKFNSTAAMKEYGELAEVVTAGRATTAAGFIDRMQTIIEESCLSNRLRDVGVTKDKIDLLAEDAMKQTRLLTNNPVDVNFEDARRLYREAF
jgi:alcohol dehydrogenase class IV